MSSTPWLVTHSASLLSSSLCTSAPQCDVGKVQVTIDKPQALAKRGAAAAACQVTRKREDFFFSHSTSAGPPVQQGRHTAANALASTPQQGQSRGSLARCEPFARHPKIAHLSLGSNVGDGASQIQKALRHLTSQGDIQVRQSRDPPRGGPD